MHNRIEIHPGVFREPSYKAAMYTGTAEALMAAGIAQDGQFPGQPGNPKTMCTFNAAGRRTGRGTGLYGRDEPGKKRLWAERDGRFTVCVQLSPERLEALEAVRVRESARWPFPVVHGAIPANMPLEARA